MRILLDTNVLLWLLEGSDRLTPLQLQKINGSDNTVFVSIGSLWEIAIKVSLRKLSLSFSLTEVIEQITTLDLTILPILPEHLVAISELSLYHRDPFDRLLIAQAKTESFVILTSDKMFTQYGIETL